jgi:drug/metabolite transporter (DMT)-like permease
MIYVIQKLISESLLSLYPIFIKKIPINLDIQLFTRLLGYSLISLFFISLNFIKQNLLNKNVIFLGLVTVFHIFFSYNGFKILDTGISYALFYTYPIMIIIWNTRKWSIYYITVLLGIFLLSVDLSNKFYIDTYKFTGIIYILLAALTEVIIFYIIRGLDTNNSWNFIFLSYFPALILYLIYLLFFYNNNNKIETIKDTQPTQPTQPTKVKNNTTSYIIIALCFNILVGMIGYYLRFNTIKKLPVIINGVLSFFGIITSYIYGIIFDNNKINFQEIIGIILIIYSNIKLLI